MLLRVNVFGIRETVGFDTLLRYIGPNKPGQLTSLILATSHSKGRKLRKPPQRRFDLSLLFPQVDLCPDLTIFRK